MLDMVVDTGVDLNDDLNLVFLDLTSAVVQFEAGGWAPARCYAVDQSKNICTSANTSNTRTFHTHIFNK